MVFGVAMNSKKNTLVALLIAANFTEIKGAARPCCCPSNGCLRHVILWGRAVSGTLMAGC